MLIDCDVHVSYETLFDLLEYLDEPTRELARHSGTYGLAMPGYPWYHPTGWIRKDTYGREDLAAGSLGTGTSLAQLREQLLDRYEVTYAIVTPDEAAAFAVLPNAHLAAHLSSAYNDWLLERWLQEDGRLRGLMVVPPQHPEAAAAEIRRLGERDEFVGVFLPGGARIPYGNPVYAPLWEAANDLALPVAVHTHYDGVALSTPVTAAGHPDFYAEYHTLCGSGMYGHFVSILCHGIFERYPNTRVIMVEGGLVPFLGFLWRLEIDWRACRTEIPWCKRPPSEYVWEHVRFTTQPLEIPEDESTLEAVLQGLRPWQTACFASDYPHWDFDDPTLTLRLLPRGWREQISHRNALDFYRLPAPVESTPPLAG